METKLDKFRKKCETSLKSYELMLIRYEKLWFLQLLKDIQDKLFEVITAKGSILPNIEFTDSCRLPMNSFQIIERNLQYFLGLWMWWIPSFDLMAHKSLRLIKTSLRTGVQIFKSNYRFLRFINMLHSHTDYYYVKFWFLRQFNGVQGVLGV